MHHDVDGPKEVTTGGNRAAIGSRGSEVVIAGSCGGSHAEGDRKRN